jgi:hypothetical protein
MAKHYMIIGTNHDYPVGDWRRHFACHNARLDLGREPFITPLRSAAVELQRELHGFNPQCSYSLFELELP